MKQFNVLDRHLVLHQHYLLEASAGTGKTFSIQNIVIRLLIESAAEVEDPLFLNKILIVTFTRAATRDLKQRIRATLEQTVQLFIQWLELDTIDPSTPDYVLAYLEKGKEFVQKAKKHLQQALFTFDQAQIFTIHSFCARMLQQYAMEGDMALPSHPSNGEEPLPTAEVMGIIRDFFRTEMRTELYSPGQLAIFLKQDPDQKKLVKAVMNGYEFADMPSCQQLFEQFNLAMKELKDTLDLTSEKMIEDFNLQSGSYRNYKSGETKAETVIKISRFAQLFDQEAWTLEDFDLIIKDRLVWIHALDPALLKAKSKMNSDDLHYPELRAHLKQKLELIIETAADFSILLARLSKDCQQLLKRYQKEEERLSPDDLLKKMQWAIRHPEFKKKVQDSYQAAIIDEFQDTDPIQWNIFQCLFLPEEQDWKGYLYLVGDPKQSIYSFRQADIYTYLAAAEALGKECCFSLETNYRSQPSLVQALNALFSPQSIPNLIPLPKQDRDLPYQPVRASSLVTEKDFQDDRGAIHFFIGDGQAFKRPKLIDFENQIFFPFIVQEIDSLREKGLSYRQFAILVRDRHQALRLAEYFDKQNVPYLNQRGVSLAESVALSSLTDVLRAVLQPHDLSAIKTALGSALIGWTHKDLKAASTEMTSLLVQVQMLRHHLLKYGFSVFFQELLQSRWCDDGITVLERLLMQERGIEIYHDLQQIVDLIIAHQYREWSTPEGLIPFLDLLQVWHEDEDERIKRFQDPAKDGVKILTLHFSKGLEFDVVFALGLVNRLGVRDELIPIEKEGKLVLTPLSAASEEYQLYCEENDAEKMRQLYVALTRSKYRLYIPVTLNLPTEQIKLGDASPIDLFLARLNQEIASYADLYNRIRQSDGQHLLPFIQQVGRHHHISYSLHQIIEYKRQKEDLPSIQLRAPQHVKVPGERLVISSFSSLSSPLAVRDLSVQEERKTPPHQYENPLKTVHTLPANSDTGLLLHHILEKVNFKDFKELKSADQALNLLNPFVQKSAFKEWQEVICSLIFSALKTPFLPEDELFCLADLKPHQLYREMPFLFPVQEEMLLEGITCSKGFIKGVVDFIFMKNGRYYIVDWKSNWLGPNFDDYELACLEQAMSENHYLLQASLYTEALKRYLRLVDPRPFEECFGGVIYVFMRGLQADKATGIYYCVPSGTNLVLTTHSFK